MFLSYSNKIYISQTGAWSGPRNATLQAYRLLSFDMLSAHKRAAIFLLHMQDRGYSSA